MAASVVAAVSPQVAYGLRVTVTGAPNNIAVYVLRVDPSGFRSTIRNAEPVNLSGGSGTFQDYEAPPDVPVRYQVTSTDKATVYGTSAPASWSSGGYVYLKDPGHPALNMRLPEIVGPQADETADIPQTVYRAGGRSTAVVVSMRRQEWDSQIVVRTDTRDEAANLEDLLASGRVLLLQTPDDWVWGSGNSIYVAAAAVSRSRPAGGGWAPARHWTIPYVVVDRPPGVAMALGVNTLGAIPTYYATLGQIPEAKATLGDLAAYVPPDQTGAG